MFLSDIIMITLDQVQKKPPKTDFMTYCHDLHKISSGYLNEKLLTDRFGFSFSDIFDHAIAQNNQIIGLLKEAEVCIITHQGYEYDPYYSHVGTYIADHYGIDCEMFDVMGQDSIATAYHLLSAYFVHHKINHAMIIYFDQPAMPLIKSQSQALSECNNIVFNIIKR